MWSFGIPPDASAWVALALAILCAACALSPKAAGVAKLVATPPYDRILVALLAVTALALSGLYVHFLLGGAPRIIDATSYFLEGRLLSQGAFTFDPPGPSASFRGRFLIGPAGSEALGVIFPPGYPLLLALGFLVSRPMWMGPLLALALVGVSYGLGLRLFQRRDVAVLAAALSAVCAALRYHTADTMSHGWAALLFSLCVYAASFGRTKSTLLAGLAAGWLCATRPLSGVLALAVAGGWLFGNHRRQLWLLALGTLPGLGLLLAHQHALTGSWFGSTQLHYYALADGPPGCFAYGFGDQVGCRHEHAEFVAERLKDGFGLWEALRTTVHRVHWHMLDLANFEPLWGLMVYAILIGFKERPVRVLALAPVGIALLYLPFYFNGSYPGGGARFLMDTIALEHVLLAWGALKLGLARWVLPTALAGYALHGAFAHQALAAREGGRPMFEPERVAQIERGVVLIDSDHGFNLGFDPLAGDVTVARHRGDAYDRILVEALGKPPSYHYRFDFFTPDAKPRVERIEMGTASLPLRYEAESTWPPLSVRGGWVGPSHLGASCASRGRGLDLNPTPGGAAELELEVHALEPGEYDLAVGWVRRTPEPTTVGARLAAAGPRREIVLAATECAVLTLSGVSLSNQPGRLLAWVRGGRANLDYAELRLRDSSTTVKGETEGNSVDN